MLRFVPACPPSGMPASAKSSFDRQRSLFRVSSLLRYMFQFTVPSSDVMKSMPESRDDQESGTC
jgi:hypothetical protein